MQLATQEINQLNDASHEINGLYQQLFESTGLNFFCYARLYNDRKFQFVSSNTKFNNLYLEKDIHHQIYQHYHFDTLERGQFFCKDIAKQPSEQDALAIAQANNIDNIIVINKHHKSYTEIINLGSPTSKNGIASTYLNNHQLIQDYLNAAHVKMHKIIQDFSVPSTHVKVTETVEQVELAHKIINADEVLAQYGRKHLSIIDLSPRETTCLVQLLQGLTSREIAQTLHLSKRTVDNNIGRIMEKLAVTSRVRLLSDLYNQYRFYPDQNILIDMSHAKALSPT